MIGHGVSSFCRELISILILKIIGHSPKCIVKMTDVCLGRVMISLDGPGTHLGNTRLGVSHEGIFRKAELKGRTHPECGQHHPLDWESRPKKGRRQAGHQHPSVRWVSRLTLLPWWTVSFRKPPVQVALLSLSLFCCCFFLTAMWKVNSTGLFPKLYRKLKHIVTSF